MCTTLAPVIGYDKAAKIAKVAYETGRTIRQVALEISGLDKAKTRSIARRPQPDRARHRGRGQRGRVNEKADSKYCSTCSAHFIEHSFV